MSVQQQYVFMKRELNERQWRHYLGMEALRIGYGGINQIMIASGADFKTIQKGIAEIRAGDLYHPGDRIRRKGGGRKTLEYTCQGIEDAVKKTARPKGNPMDAICWTSKSMEHIAKAVQDQGYDISPMSVYRILKSAGYALKANKKTIEGTKNHPDRDAQFNHINKIGLHFQLAGNPIISADCKKKELIGNFKNNGREWHEQGTDTVVNVYDFESLADGKAIPYGIYDILKKQGFVNVGIAHETAEFAVESMRRWWHTTGKVVYPLATALLVLVDGGGSNGSRNRLWKKELQELANEIQRAVQVCHYPPGTSKWNAIEHELFSFISINWRGKPLTSLEVVLELIANTTTKTGLNITAVKDTNSYPTGIKVTDKEMAQLNIIRDAFHGEWNYVIYPQMK
jgi:hypothetical protein